MRSLGSTTGIIIILTRRSEFNSLRFPNSNKQHDLEWTKTTHRLYVLW